ncbi:hypothetical protein MRX96_037642 [Rhipicephalus microplus]
MARVLRMPPFLAVIWLEKRRSGKRFAPRAQSASSSSSKRQSLDGLSRMGAIFGYALGRGTSPRRPSCCRSGDGGGCSGRAANVFRVRETIATPPGKRMRSCLASFALSPRQPCAAWLRGYWNASPSFARLHRDGEAAIRSCWCCANVVRVCSSLRLSCEHERGTRLRASLFRGLE